MKGNFQRFNVVSVVPDTFSPCCHMGQRSQQGTETWPQKWSQMPGADQNQNTSSFVAGFIPSPSLINQILGIWSKQVGFVLSGLGWPGLKGKLSHLSAYIQHLGRAIPSPPLTGQQSTRPKWLLWGKTSLSPQHKPQLPWRGTRKQFLHLWREDLMPTQAAYPLLPGFPIANAAALHWQTILIWLCCTQTNSDAFCSWKQSHWV